MPRSSEIYWSACRSARDTLKFLVKTFGKGKGVGPVAQVFELLDFGMIGLGGSLTGAQAGSGAVVEIRA